MYQTLTTQEAINLLMGDQYGGWSREGAAAMVEWVESGEEQTGEEVNFCPVAIRCEWSEYASAEEAARAYGWTPDHDDHEESRDTAAIEWLRDRTTVIEFDGKTSGVIVAGF